LGVTLDAPVTASAGAGQCAIVTRRSPDRDHNAKNEDSAALVSWAGKACVLAVADGLGGYGEGDVASALTLRRIAKRLANVEGSGAGISTAVLEAIEAANLELLDRPGSAATTILVASIEGDRFRAYHAGDSELLIVGQRGKIKFQTVSHSPVGYAVESGIIDREEGFDHEDRHIISNFVGMNGMRVEMATAIELAPRDTVVLASDGLWDNLYVDEVVEAVRKGSLLEAARRLTALADERMRGADESVSGKPDDLTVILYRRA
jgi:serine/threonine protein phosphatase PrpC